MPGPQLAHVLGHSGAKVLIADGTLTDRVAEQSPAAAGLETVVRNPRRVAPRPHP